MKFVRGRDSDSDIWNLHVLIPAQGLELLHRGGTEKRDRIDGFFWQFRVDRNGLVNNPLVHFAPRAFQGRAKFGPMRLSADMHHIAGDAGLDHEAGQVLARCSWGDMMRDVAQGGSGGWTDAPNRSIL